MRRPRLLTLLSCTILLVGCSTTQPEVTNESETRVLAYQGYVDEYRASLRTLKWPKGYTPPQDIPGIQDKTANYEVGSGEGAAAAVWLCA